MLSGFYLKRGFLLLLRAQRLAEGGGEGLMQKGIKSPKFQPDTLRRAQPPNSRGVKHSAPLLGTSSLEGAGFGDFKP